MLSVTLTILLQDINRPVKDTPFPSITICTEGINMEAVMEAVTKDFNEWLQMERNMTINDKTYTEEKHNKNVKDFLYKFYSISPSYNITVDDIALAYSSHEPDKYNHSRNSVSNSLRIHRESSV